MRGRRNDIVERDLLAYVDGNISASRKAAVEAHLARHQEDAARVADWRAQTALLHDTFDSVLAEAVPLRLSPFRLAGRRVRTRPRLLAVVSLAFAAGLGSGGLMMLGLLSLDRQPVQAVAVGADAVASRALSAHRTFAVEVRHPVEVAATEEAHLVQWLSKRISYPIHVPDLKEEGFSLLGGRLLSSVEGPAALLMFENAKGERLTLYCARASGTADTSLRYVQDGKNAAVYWIDSHAAYALSGPADRERLMRITQRVYASFEAHEHDT